jgi:hypothetical protein
MNRSWTVLAAWSVLLAGGCGATDLKPYTSREGGGFTILLPAGQMEETAPKPDQPIGTLILEQPNGTYEVAYQDVPAAAGETPEQLEHRLDEYRDRALENSRASQGELRGEKKITLAGRYPGREIVIELPPHQEWIRARIFLAEGRLYQVNASGKKGWVDSRDTEKVLDSFRVLPR